MAQQLQLQLQLSGKFVRNSIIKIGRSETETASHIKRQSPRFADAVSLLFTDKKTVPKNADTVPK